MPHWTYGNPAKRAEFMQKWADELWEFFKDHRSQDVNSVTVDATTEDQCSVCKHKWEPYQDDTGGQTVCASCGAVVEVESQAKSA